ncbi:MAG: ferrous iron transporter B, partial [Chitinispirillaceae bacterium]|nr:ferrous iron transporter B [Chitinispirillaceae bacterium]
MSFKIAFVGNPNAGKTSLFNKMAGAMQKVANWGGVTVEVKESHKVIDGEQITFVDLPGTYSIALCNTSEDERIAREYLIKEKPEVVINVVDTTNLERNLYLTVQLLEMGIRPIIALNMWDEFSKSGMVLNLNLLQGLLDCPVIPTNGRTGEGTNELLEQALVFARTGHGRKSALKISLPVELESSIEKLLSMVNEIDLKEFDTRWIVLKLFERDKGIESIVFDKIKSNIIFDTRDRLEGEVRKILGYDAWTLIVENRYGYIAGLLSEVLKKNRQNVNELSNKIDAILTHRFWAYPIFIAFMWLLFQVTFKIGEYPMNWIEAGTSSLMHFFQNIFPDGILKDIVVDGIIAGVGSVIVFLPNILIMFLGISIMEDTG